MNKYIVYLLVLFLVLPVACFASSGGSGYQERDRSGWLQSGGALGDDVLFVPDAGFKLRKVPKEVDVKVFGIEPFPYSKNSLVERLFPWSVIGLAFVLVMCLYITYRVFGFVSGYFRALISRGPE